MFRFLSKFHLATRVYGGFLLVGAYVVFLCFFAMTAVGTVQKEYTKANAVMNATRQLTALETDFYALDQALFFFQNSVPRRKRKNGRRFPPLFRQSGGSRNGAGRIRFGRPL